MPPDLFNIPDAAAGRYIDMRNKRILEDNKRQIEEAERSQREFEQRKAAEAEAAEAEMQLLGDNFYVWRDR
jgi:hypothetical protein